MNNLYPIIGLRISLEGNLQFSTSEDPEDWQDVSSTKRKKNDY